MFQRADVLAPAAQCKDHTVCYCCCGNSVDDEAGMDAVGYMHRGCLASSGPEAMGQRSLLLQDRHFGIVIGTVPSVMLEWCSIAL